MTGTLRIAAIAAVIFGFCAQAALAQDEERPPQVPPPQLQKPVIKPLPRNQNQLPWLGKYPPTLTYTCTGLKKLPLASATVISAEEITGTFNIPSPPSPASPPITGLPHFCRVVIESKPVANADILIEVWLPYGAQYNSRYMQLGNGGFAGVPNYSGLADGITRGFAAASTDDGHVGFQDASFAQGPYEKIIDFGWRSLKETSDKANAVIHAFYGSAPKYSYFFGCSDGGREAMMEAQRYPDDFDGIIVGAPANNWTHQFTALAYNTQQAYGHVAPFPAVLPPVSLITLSTAVRSQCVTKDGDGGAPGDLFLNDPRLCAIDWTKIQCMPGQSPPACLTAPQVAAVQAIYAGAKTASGQIYPGYEPGSEDNVLNGWQPWITGPLGAGPFPTFGLQTFFGEGFFANFVYKMPVINLMTLDPDTALSDANTAVAADINAMSTDLSAFRAHGGKMLEYQGWADPGVSPLDSIAYYDAVHATLGTSYTDQQSFYRLFMAPGMGHCSGGPGADAFGNGLGLQAPAGQRDADHDIVLAMQRWREQSIAPDQIIATHFTGDNPVGGTQQFQRPLCPYPQRADYDKSGDTVDASHFHCVTLIKKWPPLPPWHKKL